MNTFRVSYVTTLPKEGNAPRISISGDIQQRYHVSFIAGDRVISSGFCNTNQTLIASVRQWYTEWEIIVRDENDEIVFKDIFNVRNRVVFIKIDAYALGDNIAWIPYVDEFRKKHNCIVLCSTFHNYLFIDAYPDILFVSPNTRIDNVYAQYYIGASNEQKEIYSPVIANSVPLQMVASSALGLPTLEIRPDLSSKYKRIKPSITKKYITLSEYGSSDMKAWGVSGGWQRVVDYLNERNYSVVVISKEKTKLKNIIDLSGDISLDNRAVDILNAEFHMGISSGLSWLAWALGKHVVMVSDVTPNWHEFKSGITRIGGDNLSSVDYTNKTVSSIEKVIENIGGLLV